MRAKGTTDATVVSLVDKVVCGKADERSQRRYKVVKKSRMGVEDGVGLDVEINPDVLGFVNERVT